MLTQIIGVAYSYPSSLSLRKFVTRELTTHHSSQAEKFSYFLKGSNGDLKLQRDPETGEVLGCWPEPEVAMHLGSKHQVAGWFLGIDLTCYSLEWQGRKLLPDGSWWDGTHLGKYWLGSCSIGKWVPVAEVDDANIEIGLQITRSGQVIYNQKYSTSRRVRKFSDLPALIVADHFRLVAEFGSNIPPSKQVTIIDSHLPEGTVILCGTPLVSRNEQLWLRAHDTVKVYSPQLGEINQSVS